MTLSNLADWVGYAPADLQFVIRIVVAGLLGGIIGWQRQRKGSPAGYRTHCMITVAAAAFTSIAVDQFPSETGRVIQGILTGIGFMGSGIIWQAGNDIRGLTTAAGVWSVTAVGIMVGTGEYFLGLALFVVIFIILVLPKGPERGHVSRDDEAVAPETTDKSV